MIPVLAPARQATIGLTLAGLIVTAYVGLHVYAVFFLHVSGWGLVAVPFVVALLCWLAVGLFIVAHDCMHGSLAPFRPRLNRAIGRVCLGLYAGFWYDGLIAKHFDHHRFAGTDRDPDFDAAHPSAFVPWFVTFMREYLGWREVAVITAMVLGYVALGASVANVLLFWALPAILSSVQLFTFGTYLPHRAEEVDFVDRHRARSMDYSWLISLLTCFHFGYHHEHHESPTTPWWSLPCIRAGARP